MKFVFLEEIDSTNKYVKENLEELADKTVEVQRGIDEIRSGINEIDKAYKEVEEKKAELEKTKTALELFLKADEVIPNLPIMENAKKNIELATSDGVPILSNGVESIMHSLSTFERLLVIFV